MSESEQSRHLEFRQQHLHRRYKNRRRMQEEEGWREEEEEGKKVTKWIIRRRSWEWSEWMPKVSPPTWASSSSSFSSSSSSSSFLPSLDPLCRDHLTNSHKFVPVEA